MRFFLFFVAAITAGCVPTARSRPPTAATLNAPPPPGQHRTAAGLLTSQPTLTHDSPNLKPGPDEVLVEGAYRWAGNEYRYIPAHIEKRDAPYVWTRP